MGMLLLASGVWALYVEPLYARLLYILPPVPFLVTSVRKFFFGVLVIGMLSSDVMSWTSVSILVFSRSNWLCSCIACCLITSRSPDRTSWVPPGLRVVHGQGGSLTTIGAGIGAGAGTRVSLRSNILGMSEGLLLPPFSILFVVLFAFQVLYCKYISRMARPIVI